MELGSLGFALKWQGEGPHTRGLEMKKDGEPHRRAVQSGVSSLKATSLTGPERQSPSGHSTPSRGEKATSRLHPVQRGAPTHCPAVGWAVGHLGGGPACPVNGGDPGVVELSEVACLRGKVAGFPGDPLAALLFQPLSLSIPGQGKGWSTPFMNRLGSQPVVY